MAEQDQSEEVVRAAVPASGQKTDTMAEVPGELADQIAAAVSGVPGVVSLDCGALGDVATSLPTRQVHGVRVGEFGRIEVHIVVAFGSDVRGVVDQVRSVVVPMLSEPVDVIVADIATPADGIIGL